MSDWALRLAEREPWRSWVDSLQASVELDTVAAEARPLLVAASFRLHPRKIVVLAANYDRCLAWQARLGILGVPAGAIRLLPSGLSALFEDATPEQVALSDRIGSLEALIRPEPVIVVATAPAALERTLPRDLLEEAFVRVRPGDSVEPDSVERSLRTLGYEVGEPVRFPGQFSRRGGILDVFAAGAELPLRIEWFGDQVETIRAFDPTTQRSVGGRDELLIAPSRETLYVGGEPFDPTVILDAAEQESRGLDDEAGARLEELVAADANALSQGVFFDRLDLYRPLLHPDSGCALDLLADADTVILDEPLELEAVASRAEQELAQALEARTNRGEVLASSVYDYVLPAEHMGSHGRCVALTAMNAVPDWLEVRSKLDMGAASLEPYRGRPQSLGHTLHNWMKSGFLLVVSTDQPNRAASVLRGAKIEATEGDREKGAALAPGNLAGGFVVADAKVAVITDAELFGAGRLRLPQKRFLEGAPIATVLDLKHGDYVVHISFGIGIYRGLVKREVEGVEKEYLFIEYAPPDKLFVPADQLDRIQKYLNPGDAHPKLNRLTGTDWQRTMAKARENAREFARDLVKLYAERKSVLRRPLGADSPWQSELEATFPWVETPSQLSAIQDAKRDLQLEYPMDRLVCGDVGFGKTEVAIRAAFKVAQAGRQVAVLCPTTILSEQHFRNFSERLASFPVRLELLNRFRSTADRNRVLKDLKAGKVEIVIGTHALLAKEIEFKELGLVVVDEEQKFGVKQKEALKQLRVNVDVLSMSATPIPRTLSMALMDIRQMSLINDPPPGRLPIRTFVRPYSPDVVREALLRELARGGQVFYVYNRVESIWHVAERLRKLAPMARIGVGHGQMTESELEPVMLAFIRGELDVLLSTTIIENGIDIPNANTLIVENADRLGLSQLYQLRGRVGRSDRQAYAYLLYQSHKELTDSAGQRLQALQEFSMLGSGYSLAFRDLQIRGAGDLLGKKQHGAMTTVGYELYTQLIEEAVKALKDSVDGRPAAMPLDPEQDPLAGLAPLPTFDLAAQAHLPSDYIRDEAQRLYYYQTLMSARDIGSVNDVQAEVEDRYGRAPAAAQAAFAVMRQRIRAHAIGIDKLEGREGRLSVGFKRRASVPPRAISLLSKRKRDCYLSGDRLVWPYTAGPILAVGDFLDTFEACLHEVEEDRAAFSHNS